MTTTTFSSVESTVMQFVQGGKAEGLENLLNAVDFKKLSETLQHAGSALSTIPIIGKLGGGLEPWLQTLSSAADVIGQGSDILSNDPAKSRHAMRDVASHLGSIATGFMRSRSSLLAIIDTSSNNFSSHMIDNMVNSLFPEEVAEAAGPLSTPGGTLAGAAKGGPVKKG